MKYPGNKNISGVREQIKSLISPYDLFIEMFAGSAAVSQFISAPPAKLWLNDLSKGIEDKFVYSGQGYLLTHYDAVDILKHFSSTGTVNIISSTRDLMRMKLYTGSDDIEITTPPGRVVVFHDPPYLHEMRPHCQNLYENEPDYDWHVRYLEGLQKCLHLQHIVIHPVCDLYCEKLKDWNYKEVKIRYNSKTSVERIWFNFPEPVELVDYTSCGVNRTDRQRIKRQVNNMVKKLKLMPPVQRNYALKMIAENFGQTPT